MRLRTSTDGANRCAVDELLIKQLPFRYTIILILAGILDFSIKECRISRSPGENEGGNFSYYQK